MMLNYCKCDGICLVGPLEKIPTPSAIISVKHCQQFPGSSSTLQANFEHVEHDTSFLTAKRAAKLNRN